MTKSLIIVESPAKAKTIEKFLGRRYTVRASMGHVRDLPKSQFGVDVEKGFEPKYITIRGKGDILKELRESARKADKVYLATDPDREGEAISWHLASVLGLDQAVPCRIEFHEITKEAVNKALKRPRRINGDLVEAQQARRILDRLVGYRLSPLLWKKVRRGLSAGRVQSVAMRLISDREEEIKAFVPEEYWSLSARLNQSESAPIFEARYYGREGSKVEVKSEAEMKELLTGLEGVRYTVTSVKRRERRRNPAPPFITSTLQQEASRKLGFTVRRTMAVAQQLYEGLDLGDEGTAGLVTYIRTDSARIAEEARTAAQEYIQETFGEDHCSREPLKEDEKKKGVQGAHEAIRPTSVLREPERVKHHLSSDQYKLYKLIWERFLSSQMAPAVLDMVSVEIAAGPHVFRASGSTVKFAGFMAIYIEGQDDEAEKEEQSLLPELNEGERLNLIELAPRQHFTQPPPRYTEAMLVRALEENGIGRPSTYAPIIETIQQRGYVVKEEKRFVPTELGVLVVDLLKEYFPRIIDVEFTADFEDKLDRIEEGDSDWRGVLEEFYGPFSQTLQAAEEEIGEVELPEEVSDVPCEKCGRMMVVKYGRFGKFLACPGFPECRSTKPIVEKTGVFCPKCGGEVVERKSKKGRKFYGCGNYPNCDFVTWYKPVQHQCPECGAFLVQRRNREEGLHYRCVREGCDYQEYPEVGENE